MYVVFEPEHTEVFLTDLSDIASAHKLDPWIGSATPGVGARLFVFEAKGRALRIWAQNVLLSGNECAEFPEVGKDPGQFMVTIHPAMWWRDWKRALELSAEIFRELNELGYRVLSKPAQPCSTEFLRRVVSGAA